MEYVVPPIKEEMSFQYITFFHPKISCTVCVSAKNTAFRDVTATSKHGVPHPPINMFIYIATCRSCIAAKDGDVRIKVGRILCP